MLSMSGLRVSVQSQYRRPNVVFDMNLIIAGVMT
ncbi:hypothetical protein NB703_004335 [Pantoea ananatis]|uniref:Uncharacterized protein n=1 Tax=Pantoea ananas TaxID=553 RepID=A0AAJ1FRU8_PANAN|nr:hypothetical protein [Pantoea ananatis]PXV71726.1 hypothetical protein C7433_11329 [Pantoea sp. PNA 03-3]MCW0312687.1 hypothetical protein [Pantoea ananatis]MCW0331128.1 hypothetical protein [Pantoea ananatis]MCW0340077.1 hypothetical protein [Pantoea ananatis]